MRNSQKAFTLIELLVVISIIAMLSSIVLASLQDARAKARDATRMSDIKQIQNALELYRLDNGKYPSNTTSGSAVGTTGGGNAWAGSNSSDLRVKMNWSKLQTDLAKYIPNLPTDPKPTSYSYTQTNNNSYSYTYLAYGLDPTLPLGCAHQQYYVLIYRLETNKNANPRISPVSRCDDGTTYNASIDPTQNIGLVTTGMGK